MSILEESFFKFANEQYAELVNNLSAAEAQSWEHGEVEEHINEFGTELMRRLFQGHLDLRYAQEEYQKEVFGADGEARPHRRKKTQRHLETLFGEVVVTRVGYSTQKPGVSALYPQDGKLNLATDKYSDGLRRRVAEETAKVSFAETSETMAKTRLGSAGGWRSPSIGDDPGHRSAHGSRGDYRAGFRACAGIRLESGLLLLRARV
jgi:hypothetical protein